MISQKMESAINKQISEELYSAYLYSAMGNYFDSINLRGFAHWMRLQTDEELAHARKFRDYLLNRGGKVVLTEIKGPKNEWESPLAVFEASYRHECHISECINKLSSLSQKENDHASHAFLEWFVEEQVEEEANVDNVVQQLKLVKDSPGALFMLDRELGARQAAAPAEG
ncbi:MAG: ferritin [Candidatus Hydrogenedentes bacterium]|nr:ferritin [Candidatus Hydrogenedentota bacterium]